MNPLMNPVGSKAEGKLNCINAVVITHTLFILEDLTGIRSATERVRTEDRYVSVSWSFHDLEQKLIYKAKQNPLVIKVDPRYTSQCCLVCGHTEKSNRTRRNTCFPVKTVVTNPMMTALEQ